MSNKKTPKPLTLAEARRGKLDLARWALELAERNYVTAMHQREFWRWKVLELEREAKEKR